MLQQFVLNSGSGFVDHLFPDALGFENEFDDFARGPFPAGSFGSVIGCAFHFRGSIGHGDGKADAAHNGQVGQIVSEIGDFGFFRPEFRDTLWKDATDWILAK